MNDNPYAYKNATTAAQAPASERAVFLRKTYSLLFAGILCFAATLWAAGNVEPVQGWAMALGRAIYGSRWGWLLYMGIFMGGSMAVHAVAERRPLNMFAFFGWAFLLGLLISPIVLMIAGTANGPVLIQQASVLTAIVFGALTAIVWYTGKDFSFLRNILWFAFFGLMAIGLCGWIFGFTLGLWFSAGMVLVFGGFILYDTGQVMHRYPTTMYVSAAVVLLTDVVLLFKHLLILLSSMSND